MPRDPGPYYVDTVSVGPTSGPLPQVELAFYDAIRLVSFASAASSNT